MCQQKDTLIPCRWFLMAFDPLSRQPQSSNKHLSARMSSFWHWLFLIAIRVQSREVRCCSLFMPSQGWMLGSVRLLFFLLVLHPLINSNLNPFHINIDTEWVKMEILFFIFNFLQFAAHASMFIILLLCLLLLFLSLCGGLVLGILIIDSVFFPSVCLYSHWFASLSFKVDQKL